MSEQKRLISDNYDREKFNDGFERAAYAMVTDSYTSPDSPTAKALQDMFVTAMEKTMSKLPIAYYQMLEAIVDGKDVLQYAEGRIIEELANEGDGKLAKVMMEMTDDPENFEIYIKDTDSAEKYYNEKFPQESIDKGKKQTMFRKKFQLPQRSGKKIKENQAVPNRGRDKSYMLRKEDIEDLNV